MRTKVLCVVVLLLVPLANAKAFDELSGAVTIPLVETLDLQLDGSVTPILVPVTREFDYVLRIIFHLEYDDPLYIGTLWGEGAALANGTAIIIENVLLIDFNITQNRHLSHLAFDSNVIHDEGTPKFTRIYTKISFGEFCPNGIRIATNESLYFIVQDDMTAAANDVTDFTVIVEGFQIEREAVAQVPVENPFKMFDKIALQIITNWPLIAVIFLGVMLIWYVFRKARR